MLSGGARRSELNSGTPTGSSAHSKLASGSLLEKTNAASVVERDLGRRAGDDRRLGRGRGPRSSTPTRPGSARRAGSARAPGPRTCARRRAGRCRPLARELRPRCTPSATSHTVNGAPSSEHWKRAAGIVGGERRTSASCPSVASGGLRRDRHDRRRQVADLPAVRGRRRLDVALGADGADEELVLADREAGVA